MKFEGRFGGAVRHKRTGWCARWYWASCCLLLTQGAPDRIRPSCMRNTAGPSHAFSCKSLDLTTEDVANSTVYLIGVNTFSVSDFRLWHATLNWKY